MKKLFKILVVTVLAVSLLAGCSAENKKAENRNVKISMEDAKKNTENMVNLSNYSPITREDGTFHYAYKSELFTEFDLNYIVSLGSDTRVDMPENFATLKKLGWTLSDARYENLVLKPAASTNVNCGKDGKTVMVFVKNSTESEIKCPEGVINRIKFNLYSKDDNYAEKLKEAPDFKIGNSIDNNTDIKGIISAVGEPSDISYSEENGNCTAVTLTYQNISKNDWLKFELSPDGSKIVSVDYSIAY